MQISRIIHYKQQLLYLPNSCLRDKTISDLNDAPFASANRVNTHSNVKTYLGDSFKGAFIGGLPALVAGIIFPAFLPLVPLVLMFVFAVSFLTHLLTGKRTPQIPTGKSQNGTDELIRRSDALLREAQKLKKDEKK